MNKPQHFLPTTLKEVQQLGWNELDVILISGDAYIDHPSFGTAIIGRILEKQGLKVAVLPQPNWQDDLRDFKKLGKPRLFFGITAGSMHSMVNHYTANKRLRSDDAYTPGGVAGFRPDNATIVYSNIVKEIFPDTPVVLGGVEASMCRLSYYDYWADCLRPSILLESKADILVYGMGEKPIVELAKMFTSGNWKDSFSNCPQIAYLSDNPNLLKEKENYLLLHSFEKEQKEKKFYGENFVVYEKESNKKVQKTLIQPYKNRYLVVNPPYPIATEKEMDDWAMFDSMMNAPHPKYAKRGDIPAFEMIKNSITMHRGCFGGCSFCAISAHQGKFIASRSESSILKEAEDLAKRPYFKGHISDIGGPSANMYKMKGKDEEKCLQCQRPSCLFPSICRNLNIDHKPIVRLYDSVSNIKGVKKITIGSGIRYEMLLTSNVEIDRKNGLTQYMERIVREHVSGRLKVAPEHTADNVVSKMRKPSFSQFIHFLDKFNELNKKCNKNQQLIPYFMSGHPGCTVEDMALLSIEAKKHRLFTDQVQEFTPTPMTYSTAMYYLGYDPYTGNKIPVATNSNNRKEQHLFFFYRKKENKNQLIQILNRNRLQKLIGRIFN